MVRHTNATIVALVCIVVIVGSAAAFAPALEIVHQHDEHEGEVVDVEYGDYHDVVWSIDADGTFAAYVVGEETVEFTWDFDEGHALATSEDAVFIASGDTLWEFDVPEGEFNELGTLDTHPEDMVYDGERHVVWIGGHETIHGYDADNGSEYMSYTEHSEGIGSLDVAGDYIVSGASWESEVVVYDVSTEEVVYEPELPTDTQGISALNLLDEETLLLGALGDDANDFVAAYDVAEEQLLLEHREHIFGVSFVGHEPHNDLIVSTGLDNTVKFYDHETDAIVEEYPHEDTIYTASYDYHNSLLWLGDGEERDGLVSGLDIYYEEETTDDAPAGDDPGDETDDTPAGDADDEIEDTDDDPEDTVEDGEDDGMPGFGPTAALVALSSLIFYTIRQRT